MEENIVNAAPLRTRVLVLTGCYLPGFRAGGPIRSMRNLFDQLGSEMQFDVVTLDRDLGDTKPYSGIRRGAWNLVGKQRVHYVPPGMRGLIERWRVLRSTPHDVLYLNSFFHVAGTTWPLLLRAAGLIPRCPVILAPRGEFSQGALSLKAFKKKVFLNFIRSSHLISGVTLQATSATEEQDIRRVLPEAVVVQAPNLLAYPRGQERAPRLVGPLRAVFVGRVNRMKNLDYALRVLQGVRHPVHLKLVGPHEDEAYWAECEALIAALPQSVRVDVVGAVPPETVEGLFLESDVLLLPTLGENFGHVIAEALLSGCVPVISDQTPWQDLEACGAGFTISLDEPKRFTDVLNELSGPSGVLEHVARGAREYGRKLAGNTRALEQNRALFTELKVRPEPDELAR